MYQYYVSGLSITYGSMYMVCGSILLMAILISIFGLLLVVVVKKLLTHIAVLVVALLEVTYLPSFYW